MQVVETMQVITKPAYDVRVFNVYWIGSNVMAATLGYSFRRAMTGSHVARLSTEVRGLITCLSDEVKLPPDEIKLVAAPNDKLDLNVFRLLNDEGELPSEPVRASDKWRELLFPPDSNAPPAPITLFVTRRSNVDLAVDALWSSSFASADRVYEVRTHYARAFACFQGMNPYLQNHRRVATVATIISNQCWDFVGSALKGNRAFMMEAISRQWTNLKYAADKLKADPGVVGLAVGQNAEAFEMATSTLQQDEEFVTAMVAKNGRVMQYADHFRNTKDVVLAAVRNDGVAIKWASKPLQADKDVVLAAVRNDGVAIKWASKPLQADNDVIFAALKTRPSAVQYSDRQHENEFWAAALRVNGKVFQYLRGWPKRMDDIRSLIKTASQAQALEQALE